MLTLFGYEDNPRTKIVRIVAAAESIPLIISEVIPRKNVGLENYCKIFPLSQGKIPALEGNDIKINETVAIATYLAKHFNRRQLFGGGNLGQETEILSWACWANQELLPVLSTWFLPLIPNLTKKAPYSYDSIERGKQASLALLDKLEQHIAQLRTKFLVGQDVTLADIFVGISISRGLQWVLDSSWRDRHPATMRYFQRFAEWKFTRTVVPNIVFCESAMSNEDPYAIQNKQ